MDTAETEAEFKAYITNYVFRQDTTGTVAGPVFYRYWVNILDEELARLEKRIAADENEPERCWNQPLAEVTNTFTVGGEEVSFVGKYNCLAEATGAVTPENGGVAKMLFGKDETHYYFASITRDAAEFKQNEGERIVFAKAAADATTAEIWFIGRSLQVGPAGSHIRGVVNRIMANKTTGAFSYGLSDEGIGSTNCAMYGRSDGTKLNFQARTPKTGSTSECQDVENMTWGTGACYDAATLEPATDCAALATVPTGYGVSQPFKEIDVIDVKEDSESITDFDFLAAGVKEF